MTETFKPHPVYSEYEASNLGNVRTKTLSGKYRLIKPQFPNENIMTFTVQKHTMSSTRFFYRRFVWECFNGIIPDGTCITQKDGNPRNARLDNLETTTQAELNKKSQHKRKTGGNMKERMKPTLAVNVDSGAKLLFDSKSACAKYFSVTSAYVYYASIDDQDRKKNPMSVKQINTLTGRWKIRDPTDEELETVEKMTIKRKGRTKQQQSEAQA